MDPELLQHFENELLACRFIERHIWANGPECPRCNSSERIGRLRGCSTPFGTYKCYRCRKLFSIRGQTAFALSHVPMHKWLQAAYLSGCGTEPMKAQELSRVLNVTFKTSTLMLSRLRAAAAHSGVADQQRPNSTGRAPVSGVFAAKPEGLPKRQASPGPVQLDAKWI